MWRLAKIYYNKKEYAKALDLYEKTLRSSNVMDEFQNLAQDSLNMYADQSAKNFDEKSMHEALRLSNKLKLQLNSCNLAKGFMYLGQYKLAFDSVDKNSLCYKFIKANYDIQKGNLKNALSDLSKLNKDYLNIIYGRFSYANGELSKAKTFFEKCLNSKDEFLKQYAKLKLFEINIEKNIQNKPIDNKEFKGPFLTESFFLNAMYYFNKKNYANAINYFEKVENNRKYSEQALFYETLCLINLGKKELALKKLAILEKNYPNSTLTEKLKILLQ
ncbi:tetratricopeptide repeat protein [Desulfurella sp.]|uniref:tetratricopeptide repeat protein n=1 Tax=Desulfurella sp. TaxID=1962857 RepID=UPI0025C02BB7|nr:tetratricopeptide repeat protein [Desulfurella sp.]